MPGEAELARSTIATAFQRTMRRMRSSIASSPGNSGSCSGETVLMYRVWVSAGRPMSSWRARLSSR